MFVDISGHRIYLVCVAERHQPKDTTMTTQEARAQKMMQELVIQGDFIECGEVQCTQLAEYVANAMGCPFWLDDPTHWIWDLPVLLDA
jgi:hypothetical protein